MAMTKEGEIKKRVKEILDKAGCWYFFPAANGYGRSAIPDIICCMKGRFLAIECKKENLRPTAIQQREMDKITANGGGAICINAENVEQLAGFIERLYNENP